MTSPLLTLTLAALLAGAEPARDKPREPNPFAPSLPLLTDEEEDQLDRTVDRFIQYDTGILRGEDAKKARQDFEKLGPEAVFALIRGLNRAALIEDSCPAVVIARKLNRMLAATEDQELLQYARENIGLGVTQSRHLGVLRDLKVMCMLRKNALARAAITPVGPKPPRSMTVTELAEAVGSERGPRLKQVLQELEQRRGDEAVAALGVAAASYEGDVQQLARELLISNLTRQGASVVKAKLKDDRAEVRAAAARVAGNRRLGLGGDVIDLLADDDPGVREAAHQTLVRLSGGTDLGPGKDASESERAAALQAWRGWWSQQGSH